MNRSRRTAEPPVGLTGSPLHTASSRPNRLRRSFRQTQTAPDVGSPKSQQPEFKTPTRIPRSRAGGGFSAESPNNDSDFQQDIIWDATSPSPNRLGKKGKKQKPPGVVDISEIVNRIAPKHGRPTVAEPTLQQWIGDSATIPCTPEVQVPKPKKKSPRPNGVDDLLKLAKQFDFNMFRRDEEEVDDPHQQSPELLTEDVLDLEDDDRNDASLPVSCRPAANKTDEQLHPDQHMEDDLDFLFDGPTQRLSGSLSQVSSGQPSKVKPASREAAGKPPAFSHSPTLGAPTLGISTLGVSTLGVSTLGVSTTGVSTTGVPRLGAPRLGVPTSGISTSGVPTLGVSTLGVPTLGVSTSGVSTTANTKVTSSAKDEFEDDWENDDLLNDSFALEMTQNPQSFTAPQHSSTQKPLGQVRHSWESPASGVVQSADSNAEKGIVRQRATFKLDPNPSFSFPRIQTNVKVDNGSKAAVKDAPQNRFSSGSRVLPAAGSQRTSNPKSDPQKPPFPQRASNAAASNTSATKADQRFTTKPASVSSRGEAPAAPDPLDEDLSMFFSPDPVWDDPADDDLLCEMCEDVENQLQNAENVSAMRAPPGAQVSQLRASLPPSDRNPQPANRQPLDPKNQTPTSLACAPGRPAGVSGVAAGVRATESFRYQQTKNTSGSTNGSTWTQGGSRVPPAPRGNPGKDQFTFKKPNNPVLTVTSNVVGKCSAAEIEQKKQQAMERRRQRLQDARNLQAPT